MLLWIVALDSLPCLDLFGIAGLLGTLHFTMPCAATPPSEDRSTVQEIGAADCAARERNRHTVRQDLIDEDHLGRLEDRYRKFGSEMVGIGVTHLTQKLVERGVLENFRQAQFCGFTLDEWRKDRARELPVCHAERNHTDQVSARLANWRHSQAMPGAPAPGPVQSMRAAE